MSRPIVRQAGAVAKVFFARLRFLSVFLAVGLIVGYWDNIKNHWDKWTRPAIAPDALAAAVASDIEYYCAMHPNIVRAEPGNCPICGMPLIKRKKGEKVNLPDDVLARVQLSPQRITLAGIRTSPVEPRRLVREIHAVGVLDYAEPKVAQISAWVAGRADKLFVEYTGQQVKQGDKLYLLYGQELYAGLQEYLLARKQVNDLPAKADDAARKSAAAIYNASMQRLVLWGISREQLDQIDQEYDSTAIVPSHLTITSPISGVVVRKDIFQGGYVQVGDKPFTIADLTTLWLQVKLYERDIALVQVGQPVQINVDALPDETFPGTVTFKAFQLDPQTRTLDARVEVSNPDLRLRPGMFGDASINVPIGTGIPAATQPANHLAATPQNAKVYLAALRPYLEAQTDLAQDKAGRVPHLLHEVVSTLQPLADDPQVKQIETAARAADGQEIAALRETFKEVSTAMIDLGKQVGLPKDAPDVQVFRCPMAKANWLQRFGETANPYYGSEMLTCGGPVEPLPQAETIVAADGARKDAAQTVLAIPRSAVIETGRNRIVYVESAPGVYDMRAVQLGPQAGDYYSVLHGLDIGEKVVTAGTFLVDSENRLNPTQVAQNTAIAAPQAAHQH